MDINQTLTINDRAKGALYGAARLTRDLRQITSPVQRELLSSITLAIRVINSRKERGVCLVNTAGIEDVDIALTETGDAPSNPEMLFAMTLYTLVICRCVEADIADGNRFREMLDEVLGSVGRISADYAEFATRMTKALREDAEDTTPRHKGKAEIRENPRGVIVLGVFRVHQIGWG